MIPTAERLHTVEEYYFSRKLREVRGLIQNGKPIINMGIGSPDLAPSAQVLVAMQEALGEVGAHQYQSYQGLPELREHIAAFYADQFGVKADPQKEILPLMGSKEGIMHISMAFLNRGDEVLIPNPGYPTYSSVTRLVGGVPRYYNLKQGEGWVPNLEELEQQQLSNVKIMWVNYPHMPTGARASLDQLAGLVAFAKRHELLLVNDNPYSFVLNKQPLSLLAVPGARDSVLELNSLSKTFNMAGWRVGMVLGDELHIDAILKVKSNMDSGMFYGIQKGAIAALQSSRAWFRQQDEVYERRRKLVHKLADTLGCTYDSRAAGMFVWGKVPPKIPDSESFVDQLLYEKNLFIAPGTIFGSQGEGYVRFSLCVKEEQIIEANSRFQ